MKDRLRSELPVLFEAWFWVIMAAVLVTEVAAAMGWLPPDRLIGPQYFQSPFP